MGSQGQSWTFWRREKCFLLTRIRILDLLARSLMAVLTMQYSNSIRCKIFANHISDNYKSYSKRELDTNSESCCFIMII